MDKINIVVRNVQESDLEKVFLFYKQHDKHMRVRDRNTFAETCNARLLFMAESFTTGDVIAIGGAEYYAHGYYGIGPIIDQSYINKGIPISRLLIELNLWALSNHLDSVECIFGMIEKGRRLHGYINQARDIGFELTEPDPTMLAINQSWGYTGDEDVYLEFPLDRLHRFKFISGQQFLHSSKRLKRSYTTTLYLSPKPIKKISSFKMAQVR